VLENAYLMNNAIKRLDNGLFVMVNDTHLSKWVEEEGRLDHARHFLERVRQYIPEGGTVIDCGTSIGDHTVTYSSWVGPEGQVIGFEANPDVYECACLNLAIYPWCKIYNEGLGEAYGVAGISLNDNVGASYLTQNGREVKITPLDAYIDQVTRCDFIKVDIEGCELKFLKGDVNFISKYKPAILMEINDGALKLQDATPALVFHELRRMGYSYKVIDGKAGSAQYEILATYK